MTLAERDRIEEIRALVNTPEIESIHTRFAGELLDIIDRLRADGERLRKVAEALVENEEASARESFGKNWPISWKERDRKCFVLCAEVRAALKEKRDGG